MKIGRGGNEKMDEIVMKKGEEKEECSEQQRRLDITPVLL